MNLPLVTPENAPRDAAGLQILTRPKRYNLALAMALFPNESDEEKAFIAADDATQVHALQTALQLRDNGSQTGHAPPPQAAPQQPAMALPPQAPHIPTTAAVSPQPMAYAPQPQQYAPQPQQHAPPPPQAAQGLPPAPQYAQQAVAPQAVDPRQYTQASFQHPPQYAQQPIPQGVPQAPPQYAPPMPQAAPPAPQIAPPQQQYAPPAPQMTRAPQTSGDPGNAGQGQPSLLAQVNELKSIALGMARTQNMLMLLVLELTSNQLGVDKQSLAALAVKNSLAGEPESLFEATVSPGKAG